MFLTAYQSQKYLNPHYYLDKLTIVCGVAFQWKIGPVSEYKANKPTLMQCLGYLLKRIAKFLETLVIPLLLIRLTAMWFLENILERVTDKTNRS